MNKKTQTLIRIVLLVGTIASLYFVPWPIIWVWIQPLPDTVQEQVDQAIKHNLDGIIVYVDQAGNEPGFYTAGWHNRAEKITADPKALFKIASVGKLYNAVAIAKLVNARKLSLDGTVAQYFPELKGRIENAESITLRNLVGHTSGIPNYTDTPNFWVNPPDGQQATLELVLDQPANFMPGKGYEYCNTNYLLISMLIQRVTGLSEFEYIKEFILNPLDLHDTYPTIHEVDMDRVMSGYYIGVEEDIKTTDYSSMVASASDLGVFMRALNDHSLFKEGEEEIYSSIYKYNHTGLIPGYQTISEYHADLDAVVIQFVNTTNFDGYTWNVGQIIYNKVVKILKKQQNN